MAELARRDFVKGAGSSAGLGALLFSVAGREVWLTPRQAKAEGVPFLVLKPGEVEALEAVGETLAIGARTDGIAHFVDQQLNQPPAHALLSLRVTEVRPPYVDFYRAALAGIDGASVAQHQRGFAALDAAAQRAFVDQLRQGKHEAWKGPAQGFVYSILRNDAVDVVYGTIEGFARLDVPYMPHILPQRSW